MKFTAVTGCFDVPHIGHISLLHHAASFGLPVIMGINSDRAIRVLKGGNRPIYNENDRRVIWSSFRMVHSVIVVDNVRMTQFLLDVAPKFWVKGADYSLETLDQGEVAAARSIGCRIEFAPHIPGHSTTETINKLKGSLHGYW